MIELRDVSVRFDGRGRALEAVRGVSLRVARGEAFGIVGASGAGKSTLVRCINLLQRPTHGSVLIDGVDVTGFRGAALGAVRRRIGMVFQHFNLLHARTVFDNVAFNLKIAGSPRDHIARRVPELLRLVGLSDKADAFPAQLSGGQKQRVGIARALANAPEVLLCDEPTSALDIETTAAILELVREIHRQLGITVVLITHELPVVKAICDRVAVMADGAIVEEGSAYDVFARPRHPFTVQMVARTLALELPDRLLDGRHGRIVRIVFRGRSAEEPVLSQTTQRFGVELNLLHGKIEYIGGHPIGVILVGVSGAAASLDAAVAYLRDRTENVEVLHG